MSQASVIASVKTLLNGVSGIGSVSDRPGGVATWVATQGVRLPYFELDVARVRENTSPIPGRSSIGQHNFRFHLVRVQGWMPWHYDRNSAATWRNLLDGISQVLRENRSLGQTVSRTGLPQIVTNDYMDFEGGGETGAPATRCHHAIIECDVREYLTYHTT